MENGKMGNGEMGNRKSKTKRLGEKEVQVLLNRVGWTAIGRYLYLLPFWLSAYVVSGLLCCKEFMECISALVH